MQVTLSFYDSKLLDLLEIKDLLSAFQPVHGIVDLMGLCKIITKCPMNLQ